MDGSLGPINIPLLSDTKQTLTKDYGAILEEAVVALKGIILIDPKESQSSSGFRLVQALRTASFILWQYETGYNVYVITNSPCIFYVVMP